MTDKPAGAPPKLMRRTFVIDRGFQFKYTFLLMLIGAFISALFASMTYMAHQDARRGLEDVFGRAGVGLPPELVGELKEIDITLVLLMLSITVLMAVAFGLLGILVTHRIAGPIHVMTHYISVLAAGRYPMMRPLRKRDELKGFFERFQQAIEAMRQRETDDAEALDGAIAKLSAMPGDDARAVLEAMQAMRERKRDATDRVTVGR